MADAAAISVLFSQFGGNARTKLLILGSSGASLEPLLSRFRSLNIEHVSLADLIQQEISRHTPLGHLVERASRNGKTVEEETVLAVMRRWFWARKPDAGFALIGFPATLLQAKIFDEWLDTRDESLDAVVTAAEDASTTISEHYRMHGLLQTVSSTPAAS